MRTIVTRTIQALSNVRTFYLVMGVFVAQSVWIALSAVYPMAFDEEVHLGIIRLHAAQWSPFFNSQPEGANSFGAVVRDPSYLYHYLMSFPYRAISWVTDSLMTQVIAMRFINIALFGAALIVMWRLLRQLRVPPAVAHLSLLLFVLTPLIPQLAGQINYDNLFFLATVIALKLTVDVVQQLRSNRTTSASRILLLGSVCLLSSLVKYAFLPVMVGILLLLGWETGKVGWWRLGRSFISGIRLLSMPKRVGLLALFLLSVGLFMQMYGVNTVQYGSPVPDCSKVLSVDSCMEYSPWARNYKYAHDPTFSKEANITSYSVLWVSLVVRSLLFVINGPDSGFVVGEPLPIPKYAAYTVLIGGALLTIRYGRRLWRRYPELAGLMAVAVIYTLVLWHHNYSEFKHIGLPVAIHGRYLLSFVLLGYVVAALAFRELFRRWSGAKAVLAILAVLAFTQAGLTTYLARSNGSWLWPNSTVQTVNQLAQRIVQPFVVR